MIGLKRTVTVPMYRDCGKSDDEPCRWEPIDDDSESCERCVTRWKLERNRAAFRELVSRMAVSRAGLKRYEMSLGYVDGSPNYVEEIEVTDGEWCRFNDLFRTPPTQEEGN